MDLSGLIPRRSAAATSATSGPTRRGTDELFHDMIRSLVEQGDAVVKRPICNTERTVATRVSAFISREYGRLPDGRIRFFSSTERPAELWRVCHHGGIELLIERL
ncbi:MAG: hypothetical protein R2912_01115 [Eubacteriales bacterium]